MTAVMEEVDLQKLFEGEVICTVRWHGESEPCGKPADFYIHAHDDYCTLRDAPVCVGCLTRARSLSYFDPRAKCAECGDSPIVKSVRPI